MKSKELSAIKLIISQLKSTQKYCCKKFSGYGYENYHMNKVIESLEYCAKEFNNKNWE